MGDGTPEGCSFMRAIRLLTWCCAVVTVGACLSAAAFAIRSPSASLPIVETTMTPVHDTPSGNAPSADSLASVAAARDPFRLQRTAASQSFDPDASADAAPAPHPQRPSLELVGIALGDDPAALLDGLPGTDGTRVLRVGESVAGYTVRRILTDRVTVQGPDTTWTLEVRRVIP